MMPPGQRGSTEQETPTALSQVGSTPTTAAQQAKQTSARIESAKAKDATRRVKVVATRTGWDGTRRRKEGVRFSVSLKEGEAIPEWTQEEKEYDAAQAAIEEAAENQGLED